MIKNAILDDIDLFKRKMVHDDALINVKTAFKTMENNVDKNIIEEEEKTTKKEKKVKFNEFIETKNTELDRECPNGVTCDDYKVSENIGMSTDEQSNMKELYDFVYDEESKDTENINKFFPENVSDEIKTDNTELQRHITEYETEKDSLSHNCNFEVIGMIEINNDNDNIDGLDTLTSNYFSNL